jgi:hypothetical protein
MHGMQLFMAESRSEFLSLSRRLSSFNQGMDFGVRPAPLPNDIGISDFMEWIDTEFKALPGVISGASDFAAPSRSKVF